MDAGLITQRANLFNRTSLNRHPDHVWRNSMLEKDKKRKYLSVMVRLSSVAITVMIFAIGTAVAQDPTLAASDNVIGTPAIPLARLFGSGLSFSLPASDAI